MKKNKALTLLLCLVLVLSLAIPTTLAVSLDETEPNEGTFVPGETTEAPAAEETEAPAQEETEAPAEEEAEVPAVEEPSEIPEEGETTPPETEAPAEEPSEEPSQPEEAHTGECDGIECAEDCACECHSLYNRLINSKTAEEYYAIIAEASEEELLAVTEEQILALEAHIYALENPVVQEADESVDSVVESEILYPTKNYSSVAPFQDPVEG